MEIVRCCKLFVLVPSGEFWHDRTRVILRRVGYTLTDSLYSPLQSSREIDFTILSICKEVVLTTTHIRALLR